MRLLTAIFSPPSPRRPPQGGPCPPSPSTLSRRRRSRVGPQPRRLRRQGHLVVNVASQCGFTPQYAGLQKLHDELKDHGFSVLGFRATTSAPGAGTAEEIATFCKKNYGVTSHVRKWSQGERASRHLRVSGQGGELPPGTSESTSWAGRQGGRYFPSKVAPSRRSFATRSKRPRPLRPRGRAEEGRCRAVRDELHEAAGFAEEPPTPATRTSRAELPAPHGLPDRDRRDPASAGVDPLSQPFTRDLRVLWWNTLVPAANPSSWPTTGGLPGRRASRARPRAGPRRMAQGMAAASPSGPASPSRTG